MFTFYCQTGTLTTGVDAGAAFTGTTGNDTFTGLIDTTLAIPTTTFTALDSLDGGAGNDTLTLNVITATTSLPNVTVANIETMNIIAAAGLGTVGENDTIDDGNAGNTSETASVSIDVSGYTGLTALNITQGTDASVVAATTTDVTISGATGALEVVQAKNVVITAATANKSITVGSNVVAGDANTAGDIAGTITVTDTNQGSGNILVDSGTNVTITASSATASGVITVGAVDEATGTVTVTQNTNVTSDAVTAGAIAVTGGTTITVNKNSTNVASLGDTANNVTAGATTIVGGNTTTTVNVAQSHSATDYDSVTTAGSKESSVVTFGALIAGEAVFVGENGGIATSDLAFIATEDMTAEEVAAAFANLTDGDKQADGGTVSKGYFTGSLDAGWTSGAADGDKVTFTATANGNDANYIDVATDDAGDAVGNNATNDADFSSTNTDGVNDSSTAAVDVTAATAGAVTIDDNATASITDVTVDGYAALNIGTTTALTKLANLSLANSAGTATVDAAAGITSLNLTVNNVNNAVVISTDSTTVATLNVTATGTASSFALTAADTTDLNVSGDTSLTLTGTTTALEDVVVTGTASLDISGVSANAAKSITTTGTTGTVTASINGTAATYTGGTGVDNLTLVTGTALTKAIDLGAGNDTLTFTAAVASSTATLSGGADTDTLSMTATRAAALDGAAQTLYTNFERLTINDGAASETIDLANLGFTDYVTTTGNAAASFAAASTADVTADTFTFIYNGISYTATLVDANDVTGALTVEDYQDAVDAAVDADANILGAGLITAALPGALTLTVATAGDSLVGGTHSNNGAAITATNTVLTLDKMDTNGTLVLAGTGAVTVQVTDADEVANTTDKLNIIANVAATDYSYGVVTVADVETVNITANDTLEDDDSNGTVTTAESAVEEAALTLTAADATTVNVYGAADVALTLTGTTAVTLVDASTMTGALTVTASGTTATTIKGGSAGDSLTATTGVVDTLYGYAGDDSLTSGTKTIMYGGEGNDTFNINFVASQTVNDYAVIKDLASGDIIELFAVGGNDMAAFAKLTVANTPAAEGMPNLEDYANAAALQNTTDNGAVWFTFNGNTFIFIEGATATNTATFQATEDNLVMITGTAIDLSTGASFNETYGTLEIA
ncbi:MAG: hypothetical protein WC400_03475 [Patescibacteria group bacterium]